MIMHKWCKTMADCLKGEVEAIGMNNLSPEQICDVKNWSEIIKNMTCFDKDYKIIEAMDKAENEDNMEMIERYTDYPVKHYRGRMRDSKGRYMYTEMPEMYEDRNMRMYEDGNVKMYHDRDVDIHRGRMYYTSSRLEDSRKKLEEHLAMNDKSQAGVQKEMQLATEMADALQEFLNAAKGKMSNESKTAFSHKFTSFADEVMR